MENKQYKHNERTETQRKNVQQSVEQSLCPNCGEPLPQGAAFCEMCGAPVGGHRHCGKCGCEVKPNQALCPQCGAPVTSRCTFCGSEMPTSAAFCPECGNPRSGITCPDCGTLNYRSFCRKCNRPLNPMALYAVEQAKKDPRYQRATKIADELQAIEDEIQLLLDAEKGNVQIPAGPTESTPDDQTALLMKEYEDLINGNTSKKSDKSDTLNIGLHQGAGVSGSDAATPKPSLSLSIDNTTPVEDVPSSGKKSARVIPSSSRLEQLKALHKAKLEELQKEMDAMIPDPSDPPEIKRNFACARQIRTRSTYSVQKKETLRLGWVCNMCNILHNNPSECCVAEYGGKWITKDIVTTTTHTEDSTKMVNL